MNQLQAMEVEEDVHTAKDYLRMLRRRRWSILFTSLLVTLLTLLVAVLLPATYSSRSTILIEEQEVPREFVVSTITSYAAQQIQVISQRVLTAENISEIADRHDLFVSPTTGRQPPATIVADAFRSRMALELVSADVIDPQSGRPREATIAFTLSFSDGSPTVAQRITSELVTLFLDENLRDRTERVRSTETFLDAQADALEEEISRIASEIAEIKEENGAALPELYQYNLSSLDRSVGELGDLDRRLRALRTQRLEIDGNLRLADPNSADLMSTGETLYGLHGQLQALYSEYQQKSTRYLDEHPDMTRLRQRIDEVEAAIASSDDSEMVKAASNPSYVLLQTRLAAIDTEIQALSGKRPELEAKVSRFERLLSMSPSVEIEYNARIRDLQTTQQKYQEVRSKQREAELSENMEQERKGQRFNMVEPPNLPLEPSSPNRKVILAIGVIFALAAGIAVGLLLEALDGTVYDARHLARITGVPPFAVVGYIETEAETARTLMLRKRSLIAAFVLAMAAIVFWHFFVTPIDVLWYRLFNGAGN